MKCNDILISGGDESSVIRRVQSPLRAFHCVYCVRAIYGQVQVVFKPFLPVVVVVSIKSFISLAY